jgi:MFS family permease
MNSAIRYKLILMMFLEYIVWGAWFPLLNNYIGPDYLNFDWLQGALINDAFAIMSLTAIFFGGQLADRYFSRRSSLHSAS